MNKSTLRDGDRLITAERAASIAGVTAHTIGDWCRNGHIPGAVQRGERGRWLVPLRPIQAVRDEKERRGVVKLYPQTLRTITGADRHTTQTGGDAPQRDLQRDYEREANESQPSAALEASNAQTIKYPCGCVLSLDGRTPPMLCEQHRPAPNGIALVNTSKGFCVATVVTFSRRDAVTKLTDLAAEIENEMVAGDK